MTATHNNLAIPTKRHAVVRKIRCAWRSLTGGPRVADSARRTLVACSGGADSCALALALAGTEGLVIAHVVHDLRPRPAALADHNAVRSLAAALATPFVSVEVRCRAVAGNLEATARRLRYAALADLAARHGCSFVATAHHADDQLETLLMRLARGSGPAGLAGIPPRRRLDAGVQLIRPMLAISRESCQRLCSDAHWTWQVDATNADTSRLRAALRANVIPALKAIRPDITSRAAQTATLQRAAARVIASAADTLWHNASHESRAATWPRPILAAAPGLVLGDLIRIAHRRIAGTTGLDQLSAQSLRPILRAIRGSEGQERVWTVGGLTLQLTRRSVVMAARPS